MKQSLTKFAVTLALTGATILGSAKSEAAIGVISLLGGPGGIVLIKIGAGVLVGGVAGVEGVCAIGERTAGWSADCPIFMNIPFWSGLALMGTEANSASVQIADRLRANFQADDLSANRIADRIYNRSLRASQSGSVEQHVEGQFLISKLTLSPEELATLATPEFQQTAGYSSLLEKLK